MLHVAQRLSQVTCILAAREWRAIPNIVLVRELVQARGQVRAPTNVAGNEGLRTRRDKGEPELHCNKAELRAILAGLPRVEGRIKILVGQGHVVGPLDVR